MERLTTRGPPGRPHQVTVSPSPWASLRAGPGARCILRSLMHENQGDSGFWGRPGSQSWGLFLGRGQGWEAEGKRVCAWAWVGSGWMASIHRSEGLCPPSASYPPSRQSSHAASENTVAVCHKRTLHQANSSSLQVMGLLELAGDKEPPGVSPELCQANSPPTANYLLGQERRLQPDQRGLQTAGPTPSIASSQPRFLILCCGPRPRRIGSSGLPWCPRQWAMKEAKCAKLTILKHLSHWQTLPGFWSLGPETQARVRSSQVAPDQCSWLKPSTRPSREI